MEYGRLLFNFFFIPLFLIMFGAWIFGVIEAIGMWRLWLHVFRIGFIAINETVSFPFKDFDVELNKTYQTSHGRFKFLNHSECIFTFRRDWFSWGWGIRTPFPFKGRVFLKNGVSVFEGRLPFGTSIFILAWLMVWMSVGLIAILSGQLIPGLELAGIGLLFAGSMYFIGRWVEEKRIRQALGEIQKFPSEVTNSES